MQSVQKTRVKLFRLRFFTNWRIQSKKSSFSTEFASRNSQSKPKFPSFLGKN